MFDLVSRFWGWIWGGVTAVWDAFVCALIAVWDAVLQAVAALFSELWAWAQSMIPAGWFDVVDLDMATVGGYFSDVSWILPVREVFTLVAATYAIVITLRVVRWALGFVPTIGA